MSSRRPAQQSLRRPAGATGSNNASAPPPYSPVDASPTRQQFAPPSGPPPSSVAPNRSRNPFDAPSSSPYPGGFRVEADPSAMNAPVTAPAAGPGAPAPGAARPLQRRSTREDLLDMLRKYNTVIVVDDSSSMAGRRWSDTRAALAELASTAAGYDLDGVDIHFLNSEAVGRNIKDAASVERLFAAAEPEGITPTGEKLEILLLDYILQIEEAQDQDKAAGGGAGVGPALKAIKPLNLVILTDGEPSDDPESVIVMAAKRLDARHFPLSQVGISFVQIGDDARAAEALKELDENLSGTHGIRDMVDTTPYSPGSSQQDAHGIAKMLLGGINRRVDKKGAA